jgi:predicted nucleic acid-binding protein
LGAGFVVDASVGFAWVYEDQATPETDLLLSELAAGAVAVAPAMWFLEVGNVLLTAQRRQRLTPARRRTALETLGAVQFIVDDEATRYAFGKTSELAEKYGLTVYDAHYLEVALRRKLPLGSRDDALRQAAKRFGVKVLLTSEASRRVAA